MRSLSRREKMSNSRSPRAVRSMTMGTSGMARHDSGERPRGTQLVSSPIVTRIPITISAVTMTIAMVSRMPSHIPMEAVV